MWTENEASWFFTFVHLYTYTLPRTGLEQTHIHLWEIFERVGKKVFISISLQDHLYLPICHVLSSHTLCATCGSAYQIWRYEIFFGDRGPWPAWTNGLPVLSRLLLLYPGRHWFFSPDSRVAGSVQDCLNCSLQIHVNGRSHGPYGHSKGFVDSTRPRNDLHYTGATQVNQKIELQGDEEKTRDEFGVRDATLQHA